MLLIFVIFGVNQPRVMKALRKDTRQSFRDRHANEAQSRRREKKQTPKCLLLSSRETKGGTFKLVKHRVIMFLKISVMSFYFHGPVTEVDIHSEQLFFKSL